MILSNLEAILKWNALSIRIITSTLSVFIFYGKILKPTQTSIVSFTDSAIKFKIIHLSHYFDCLSTNKQINDSEI